MANTLEQTRDVLGRVLRDGTAVASDGTVHDLFPVAISAAEGDSLRRWVQREDARNTIEVGLGYGVAALFVFEGLLARERSRAHHVAIDPNQGTRFANCGLQLFEEARVNNLVEFHGHESQLVLPRLLSEGRTFDFAFVDGNHRFEGVFLDLAFLGRLVRAGGIVFVDDYQLPAVARAASFFLSNLGWTLEESSASDPSHHWAVLRTSTMPDTRPFDYYLDF